ncbi:MAG: FecR domain-containing protein [Cyanobacteriota bacterium]
MTHPAPALSVAHRAAADGRRPRPLPLLIGLAATAMLLGLTAVQAAAPVPRVVEVPFRPAFVRPPGGAERLARAGQILAPDSLLRTAKPGRLQVLLANGRQFRLGGDAVLRLGRGELNLEKGQIIAWVNPAQQGGSPLRIRTRTATASIVGTTVFIEATDDSLKVFSWEGHVQVETDAGRRYDLRSGQQLSFEKDSWQPLKRLSQSEAAARRQKSILLNGFATPMETLPVIEKELGLSAASAPAAP